MHDMEEFEEKIKSMMGNINLEQSEAMIKNANFYKNLYPILPMDNVDYNKVADEIANYKSDILETLKNIESNTSSLKTIVDLLQDSNENQEDMLKIIIEILELTKLDKNAAEGKFKKIIGGITQATNSADTMMKLFSILVTVYNWLHAAGKV